MRKNLDLDEKTIAVADKLKAHGQSTKAKLEEMLDTVARDFYQDCADREGISLKEWLAKEDF